MLIPIAALALAAVQPAIPPSPRLARPFEAMEFLIGHCWRGELRAGLHDTHCFERVYGSRFLRDRHEVTGGYEGETLYNWNVIEGRAEYTYWNNAGGISRGTMLPRDGLLDFGDEVYRAANGGETRISTTWRRLDEHNYEVRVTSAGDPTGSRVTRFTRVDRAPVTISSALSPDGSHSLVHEVVVDAPAAAVWQAIATAEGWKTWAVPVAWSADGDPDLLETSYTPSAQPGDRSTIRQRFLARVPGRILAFRTERAPEGFPNFDTYRRVTSLFEIEPLSENRTRVRLTGSGYADTEAGRQLLGFFRDGNRVSLERLRQRFETGPLDWAALLRARD